jgi:hypothetical protein
VEKGKEYRGNNQIEYNATAIGALGLIALYLRDQDGATRDALLRLASHPTSLRGGSAWPPLSGLSSA